MTPIAFAAAHLVVQSDAPPRFDSLWDTLVRGGPAMIPLAICSIVALAWMIERAIRLRSGALGSAQQAEQLVAAARDQGPTRALDVARANPTLLSKIFQPALERWSEPGPIVVKAVEDSGSREVRGLLTSLRPLTVITVTAPLLGLFGTVIGIIIAFRDIAQSDAMGKPEALATGIAQALVATASGLAVAIPSQAAYYWFRSRIDRFRNLVEDTGERLFAVRAGRAFTQVASPPRPPPAPEPVNEALPVAAQGTP